MSGLGGDAGRCPPWLRSVVVAGGSGRFLGSAASVDRAHDWAHGQIQVGMGRLWVVDLGGLVEGSLTVGEVTPSGCREVSLSVRAVSPVERCGGPAPARSAVPWLDVPRGRLA
jgi:hypothetical protein